MSRGPKSKAVNAAPLEGRHLAIAALVEIDSLMHLMIREVDRLQLPEALRGLACRTIDLADQVGAVVIGEGCDEAEISACVYGRKVGPERQAEQQPSGDAP